MGSNDLVHHSETLCINCRVGYTTVYVRAKSLQSCLTLCDPMGHNPLGSSAHRILQARILECLAMPSSRRSSPLKNGTHLLGLLHCQPGSLLLAPTGKPTQLSAFLKTQLNFSINKFLRNKAL